jgi:hypothetical protein
MKIARTLLFAALGVLASAPPSAAILFVCPTDSPGPCAPQQVPVSSPGELIELWVQGSNGVDLTIEVSGGVITGFDPNLSEVVRFHPDPNPPNPPTTQIHIAGVRDDPTDPPPTFQLGTLIVDALNWSFKAEVKEGSEGVAAGDAIEVISPAVIPEPAQWLMLTAGSTVLAALGRRRSRLAKHRV